MVVPIKTSPRRRAIIKNNQDAARVSNIERKIVRHQFAIRVPMQFTYAAASYGTDHALEKNLSLRVCLEAIQ